jgi:hypothetical protein
LQIETDSIKDLLLLCFDIFFDKNFLFTIFNKSIFLTAFPLKINNKQTFYFAQLFFLKQKNKNGMILDF